MRLAGGDLAGLSHIRVTRALDAIACNKERPSKEKDAIPVHILRQALQQIPKDPMGDLLRTAILLMFLGALRQSEVAPPTVKGFNPYRHLTRGDMHLGSQLRIRIKWGKNMQKFDQKKDITLFPTGDSLTCPVRAVKQIMERSQHLPPSAPLLVFPLTDTPVPTSYLRARWGQLMRSIGQNTDLYSLHSLRKASVTTAYGGGCSELEVQRHGGWSSKAHRAYIKTISNRKIGHVLSSSIKDN